MSQTYDPNNSEHSGSEGGQGYPSGQSYPSGQAYPGGQSYGAAPGYGAGGYGAGGYGAGAGYGGGPGFGSEPPPPARRSHKRGLAITAAAALVAGAAVGGVIGSTSSGAASTATATSKTMLSTSQIAARVDPALVDVVSTDGDQQATSEGTGIVLTSNGEVLTNNHVINGATSIKVTDIGNGKTYTAKVVGYTASQDVAVIQLQNASGLTVASLGNSSSVQNGDSVVALGNAEGKGGTPSVAAGTVTALNQSITASDELSGVNEQLTGLIEDNADIQPGDSGGSLVNSYGQVIGMDTAASSASSGSSESPFQSPSGQSGQSSQSAPEQAYAIPINEAVSIAQQIEAGTTTTDIHIGATAFLGVEIQSASDSSGSGAGGQGGFGGFGGQGGFGGFGGQSGSDGSQSGSDGGQSASGVSLAGTLAGSPAANAGLGEGDEITAIGGQSVSTSQDLSQALVKHHPGDSISITWVDQTGQSHTSTLTLASGPAA
jgi:S1-C subfamily serine protease